MVSATRIENVSRLRGQKQRSNEEFFLIATFVLFFCQDPVIKISEMIVSRLGFGSATVLALFVIYSPLVHVLISRLHRREKMGMLPFTIVAALLLTGFFSSYLLHPEYAEVLFGQTWRYNIWRSVFSPLSGLWAFLIISLFRNGPQVLIALKYFAYVNFLYCLSQFMVATSRGYWVNISRTGAKIHSSYSLGFGYDILASVLIFLLLASMREKRARLHAFLGFIGSGLILVGGNRGALLFALVGSTIYLLYSNRNKLRKNPVTQVWVGALLLAAAVGVANFEKIVLSLLNVLGTWGLQSRTLESMLQGEFTDPNGRDKIAAIAEQALAESPGLGLGFYGDRFWIRPSYWWGYPHSIVLELQLTFGYILGTIILVLLLIYVARSFTITDDTIGYRYPILFFGTLSLQLVVSGSYLYLPFFWGLLGLCYNAIRQSSSASSKHRTGKRYAREFSR